MPRKKKLPEGMTQRPGRDGYYADFAAHGRRVQRKLSDDFETARKILHQLRARADAETFGLLDNDYPVLDLRIAYLDRCRQELAALTVERYEQALDGVLGWLRPVRCCDLTIAGVLAYRQERLRAGISPRTINHDVGVAVTMLDWGVGPARLIGSNPLAGLAPLPHPDRREGRALTDDEVRRLLERSRPHWRRIWYAFLVTGLRSSELGNLEWTAIDWEAREIEVTGKRRKKRRVPIEDGLWAELVQRRESCATGRIFFAPRGGKLTRGNIWRALRQSCRRAEIETSTCSQAGKEIEHVDVHSLRRTFATNAIANGADPKSVQYLLGHATLAMTMQVYAKVHAGSKRAAVGRLSYGQGAASPQGILPLDGERESG